MKLTVLGNYGPYPKAGCCTSGYLLESDAGFVILDFGSGIFSKLMKLKKPEDAGGIVLSHLHNDHISDLGVLSYYLQSKKARLNLYLPLTECTEYDWIAGLYGFNLIPIIHLREIRIKDFNLTFYSMPHSKESFAVKAVSGKKSLFYGGDSEFSEKIVKYAAGCDFIMLDCAQPSDSAKISHMKLSEGAFIAGLLQTPVIATHLNPEAGVSFELKKYSALSLSREDAEYRI